MQPVSKDRLLKENAEDLRVLCKDLYLHLTVPYTVTGQEDESINDCLERIGQVEADLVARLETVLRNMGELEE